MGFEGGVGSCGGYDIDGPMNGGSSTCGRNDHSVPTEKGSSTRGLVGSAAEGELSSVVVLFMSKMQQIDTNPAGC